MWETLDEKLLYLDERKQDGDYDGACESTGVPGDSGIDGNGGGTWAGWVRFG